MKVIRALFAVMALAVSCSAGALVIDSSLLTGQVYSGSVSGSFDLASQVGPINQYTINSATVRFNWIDDASDQMLQQGTVYMGTNYGPWGTRYAWGPCCDPDYRIDRTVTTYYTRAFASESESVSLTLSGMGAGSAGSSLNGTSASSSSVYRGETLVYVDEYCSFNGWFGCWDWDRDYYFNLNYDQYNDQYRYYGGSFFQEIDLVAGNFLSELLQTGVLSFGLNLFGDAVLTGATLEVDLTRIPSANNPAQVPEPLTLGLVGIGLIGMGLGRRKKH